MEYRPDTMPVLRTAVVGLFGAVIGAFALVGVWLCVMFFVIYPLCSGRIPDALWYGSWCLAMFLLTMFYRGMRHEAPTPAAGFLIGAVLASAPQLLMMWLGANLGLD